MIKTLQISSILAVVIAAVLFVSSIVFGVHTDPRVEAFLETPGIKEQFAKLPGRGPARRSSQPLVEKAQAFARLMNPPKPEPRPASSKPTPPQDNTPVLKTETRPLFKVMGVSFYPAKPERSLVLVDEPGKGMHWVRQGSTVMKLTIEKVEDGKIMVRDSTGKVTEMPAERRSILMAGQPTGAAAPPARPVIPPRPVTTVTTRTRSTIPPRPATPGRSASTVRRTVPPGLPSSSSGREDPKLAELNDRLKAIRDASKANSGKVDTRSEAEREAEAMEMVKKLLLEGAKEKAGAAPGSPSPGSRTRVPPPASAYKRSR